jgi:hypothetical protein
MPLNSTKDKQMSSKKNSDLQELTVQSLGAGVSISSGEHAISSFASEVADIVQGDYEIPSFYNIDTLKCLSVNVNTVYVYWEVTEALLESKGVLGSALLVKLCDEEAGDELMNFFITERLSCRFVNIHLPNRTIHAKIGALIDGVFVEFLRSNSFFTPTDEITMGTDELWMSKSKDFEEILKASISSDLSHLSSFGIVKELEFLREKNKNFRTNVSSLSVVDRNRE